MIRVESAGCGEIGDLNDVCVYHLDEIDFDGFTMRWHVVDSFRPDGSVAWSSMWRRPGDPRANMKKKIGSKSFSS